MPGVSAPGRSGGGLQLPPAPVRSGGRPFSWSLFYEHFHQLGKLWKNRNLRVSEMGIGYFWFFGGTVMLMTIQM